MACARATSVSSCGAGQFRKNGDVDHSSTLRLAWVADAADRCGVGGWRDCTASGGEPLELSRLDGVACHACRRALLVAVFGIVRGWAGCTTPGPMSSVAGVCGAVGLGLRTNPGGGLGKRLLALEEAAAMEVDVGCTPRGSTFRECWNGKW